MTRARSRWKKSNYNWLRNYKTWRAEGQLKNFRCVRVREHPSLAHELWFCRAYVLLGQNWGKTCRPGERCPLILIHGIFIRSLVELCPNLEICGFSMLSYPKLKELWLSSALARPWFLQCSKLFFLSILGSRFQTPFDSWSVCEVVKEAILHMQQELRNEADRILKFGSCGGTWRRIEVFCYPTPQFYGISLCSKVYLLCSYIYIYT